MNINFNWIILFILFVILISIQYTLNKIYVLLKEMNKSIVYKKNNHDFME